MIEGQPSRSQFPQSSGLSTLLAAMGIPNTHLTPFFYEDKRVLYTLRDSIKPRNSWSATSDSLCCIASFPSHWDSYPKRSILDCGMALGSMCSSFSQYTSPDVQVRSGCAPIPWTASTLSSSASGSYYCFDTMYTPREALAGAGRKVLCRGFRSRT